MGAVLYSGSNAMPHCLPSSYGQNGTRLVPLRDHTAERLGGVRCRKPAGEFAPFGRKNVPQPVEEEFLERTKVRAVFPLRPVEKWLASARRTEACTSDGLITNSAAEQSCWNRVDSPAGH
jgi:hypothetical protein